MNSNGAGDNWLGGFATACLIAEEVELSLSEACKFAGGVAAQHIDSATRGNRWLIFEEEDDNAKKKVEEVISKN